MLACSLHWQQEASIGRSRKKSLSFSCGFDRKRWKKDIKEQKECTYFKLIVSLLNSLFDQSYSFLAAWEQMLFRPVALHLHLQPEKKFVQSVPHFWLIVYIQSYSTCAIGFTKDEIYSKGRLLLKKHDTSHRYAWNQDSSNWQEDLSTIIFTRTRRLSVMSSDWAF